MLQRAVRHVMRFQGYTYEKTTRINSAQVSAVALKDPVFGVSASRKCTSIQPKVQPERCKSRRGDDTKTAPPWCATPRPAARQHSACSHSCQPWYRSIRMYVGGRHCRLSLSPFRSSATGCFRCFPQGLTLGSDLIGCTLNCLRR